VWVREWPGKSYAVDGFPDEFAARRGLLSTTRWGLRQKGFSSDIGSLGG
jgi:hypothetical protein